MYFSPNGPGGLTKFRSLAVTSTDVSVKAAPGAIHAWNIVNLHSAAIYVKFYDALVANVTVGTTVPVATLQVPANSSISHRPAMGGALPLWFTTGIAVAVVTGAADNNTTAAATLPIIELEYA